MAASVAPAPMTTDQIAELVKRGDGNPFFVEQLLAASQVTALSEELAELQSRLDGLKAERDAAVRELEETREQLDDSRAANLVAAEFEAEPDAPRDSASTPDERRTRRTPPAAKSG